MSLPSRIDDLGRRFARVTTRAVVARPGLWPVFRVVLRRQFDVLAPTWDMRRGAEALAPLVAALDRLDGPPGRVLDLGTGTGKGARLVAERYPEASVVGVDVSPRMVEEAARLLVPGLRERVTFEVGDAAALRFPDGSFDLVLLLNMIPFFGELARVTAPGGTIVFSFSSGSGTPIWVPPETLRARLAPLGFGSFDEVETDKGLALVARRER
jgi:SAM-dependent methyltransferase